MSTRVQEHSLVSLHSHMFSYKIDIDVLGTANTLVRNEVTRITRDLPYIFPGAGTRQNKMLRTAVNTEGAASQFLYNPSTPTTLAFTNPAAANNGKNKWGNNRSYAIYIPGTVSQLNDPTCPWMPAVEWTQQNIVVTQRKETEKYSSRPMYDMQAPSQPIRRFSSFTDGDSLAQQDLVAWVSVGTVHMPSAEDVPVTSTSTSGINFFIRPSNYYDESPATDLSNFYYRSGSGTQFVPPVPTYKHDIVPSPDKRCTDNITPPEIQ